MASYTLRLSFNANGGSGAPSGVTQSTSSTAASVTVSATIPSTRPTRSGYTFAGWSGNGGTYQPGASVSKVFTRQFDDQGNIINQNASIYFTAKWNVQASTWGTTPATVQLDGSTEYTFNITKASTVDHHTVTFALSAETMTFTNVGTSVTVTFPTSWQAQTPNSTTAPIACFLVSMSADEQKIGGTASKTVTGEVPATVVPTLTLSHQAVNSNSTIAGWGVLVQGFSQIELTANASGAGGSTISNISFSGAGLQKSGTETSATSDVFVVNGWQTWTVVATDSRGRSVTETYSEIVYEYSPPRLASMEIYRCNADGTPNASSGTYCLFTAHYSISRCGGNNSSSVRAVESKLNTASSWTTVYSPYTVDTSVVLSGTYDVDKIYDVRFTVTDGLGNTIQETAILASVLGFALGLKNDRARFGGVPVRDGLQIDWEVYAPKFVQTGTITAANVASGSTKSESVTFTPNFDSAPVVIATLNTTQNSEYGNVSVLVDSITASGCTIRIVNNATQGKNVGATWVAVRS